MSVFFCPICDLYVDSDFVSAVELGDEVICEHHLDDCELAVAVVYHQIGLVRQEMNEESLSAPRLDMYLDRMQEILDNHIPLNE